MCQSLPAVRLERQCDVTIGSGKFLLNSLTQVPCPRCKTDLIPMSVHYKAALIKDISTQK